MATLEEATLTASKAIDALLKDHGTSLTKMQVHAVRLAKASIDGLAANIKANAGSAQQRDALLVHQISSSF